jgi:hypothetical protein
MTDEQMYMIYMASPSMRYAAKAMGLPVAKLRLVRDAMKWPLKFGRAYVENVPPKARLKKYSIYDAIETNGGLSESDLKRALEL